MKNLTKTELVTDLEQTPTLSQRTEELVRAAQTVLRACSSNVNVYRHVSVHFARGVVPFTITSTQLNSINPDSSHSTRWLVEFRLLELLTYIVRSLAGLFSFRRPVPPISTLRAIPAGTQRLVPHSHVLSDSPRL
ncbi:hypothetical protein DFH09DRAFT_1356814 [Mycena vulgaris]|nr:hypothetical protein DFH09DRAFT_1356814 [Mycena vulgaris]